MGMQYAYVAHYRAGVSEEVLQEKVDALPDIDDFILEYNCGEVWLSAFFYSSCSFASVFEEKFHELIRATLAKGEVATCTKTVDGEESFPTFIVREGDEVKARDTEVAFHEKKIKEHQDAIKELMFHPTLIGDLEVLRRKN